MVTPDGTSPIHGRHSVTLSCSLPGRDRDCTGDGTGTGGTMVTITGTIRRSLGRRFRLDAGDTFASDTAKEITLSSPAGTGTVDVTVVTPNGTSATSSADHFSYVSARLLRP